MPDLSVLYSPFDLAGLHFKNRFIQSPMHTRFASEHGEVTPKLIDYMTTRAHGGVSLIILENTAVDWLVGRAAGNPVRIDDDRFISGLFDLTEAVHREGAFIATQLHHAGRQNSITNTEGRVGPVAPSAVTSSAIGDEPRELTVAEIQAIVEQFREAAVRTVAAGFDMVEIHGSHGYILTQFLSPQSNLRTDEYGGTFEKRARFPAEVVRAVRQAVGPDFPVSYRISLEERTPGGMSAEDGLAFCKLIEEYVDVFNVTAATYETMDTIFMMHGRAPAELLPLAARVKAAVNKPVIGISRLGWALPDAAQAITAGHLDLVALGRTQLTDANLVLKVKHGQDERVRRCIGCNECVGGFLFQGRRLHCVMNPELGYERDAAEALRPVARPRRVMVVGGGPAGVEAARAAAIRGHQVTLVEARDRIGGQVLIATAPEYKRMEMEAYVRYFEEELDYVGVRVVTGTEFDETHPLAAEADVIVWATGSPALPVADGMLDATEVMRTAALPDGPVLVLGANEIGLNAAAFAAQQGRATTVVTFNKPPGYDINPLLAGHTVALLERAGVAFTDQDPGTDAVRLRAADYHAGEPVDIDPFDSQKPEHLYVGARITGGRLYEATQSGFWTGARI